MSDNSREMAHQEAEDTKAVDRYLLKELTDDERARFEEHYFECAACAEAVLTGQVFVQGIEPVAVAVPWWRPMLEWLGAPLRLPAWRVVAWGAATAALVVMIGLQKLKVGPAVQGNTVIMAMEGVKGSDGENQYAVKTPSVTIEMVVPFDSPIYPFFRIKIVKAHGPAFSQVVPTPVTEGERRLSIQLSREAAGDGVFSATVEGLASENDNEGRPVETYSFAIKK